MGQCIFEFDRRVVEAGLIVYPILRVFLLALHCLVKDILM